jgi:putative PIN family toxin of toxin-antitoxin system
MIRIVLDTNVVVSAMLSPSRTAADVLRLALHRRVQLCVSDAILEEYEDVLRRPKCRRPSHVISALMKALRATAETVAPTETLTVSADEADNRFLECAKAAGADYLVTGNLQHFPRTLGRTRIITARQLVEIVTPTPV